MSEMKLVASLGEMDEMWEAALKESGFRVLQTRSREEVGESGADFLLFHAGDSASRSTLSPLTEAFKGAMIALIEDGVSREELKNLKSLGSQGCLSLKTPAQEVALRLRAMSEPRPEGRTGESRSSRRVWFQQVVDFKIFDKNHQAWSTTLSETGIFIRTPLSFPLYSVLHLKFHLFGDPEAFSCDGVIVRQEVESDVKGLGVMFQNLRGENVRRLEAFFESYS